MSNTTVLGYSGTYDLIFLSQTEWGNEVMRDVAKEYFEQHPGVPYVEVYEHAGWFLGFRKDMSIWATANGEADLSPGIFPEKYSGVEVRRK